VVPVHCGNINLDDVLEGLVAVHTTFLVRYFGLPLSIFLLLRVDFQHLENKDAKKIPT
jgi:hypothetical protein